MLLLAFVSNVLVVLIAFVLVVWCFASFLIGVFAHLVQLLVHYEQYILFMVRELSIEMLKGSKTSHARNAAKRRGCSQDCGHWQQ